MKAISIRQPWASMIASGEKTIETRTWSTKYRGPLLIVASKKPAIEGLPSSVAVATVRLVNCRPMTREDEAAAKCDLYPNAVAWILTDIKPITSFPVKGQLGLYDVHKRSPETDV